MKGPFTSASVTAVDRRDLRAVAAERLPGLAIRFAARRQTARVLKRGERTPRVRAQPAVDLARRKPAAIEQHLEDQRFAARGSIVSRRSLLCRGVERSESEKCNDELAHHTSHLSRYRARGVPKVIHYG